MPTLPNAKPRRTKPSLAPLFWVGGKSRVVDFLIAALLPPARVADTHFIDGHVGSGVVSLAAIDRGVRSVSLRDAPGGVARWWAAMSTHNLDELTWALDAVMSTYLPLDAASYQRLRTRLNESLSRPQSGPVLCALFLVLNWSGYNGLWRTAQRTGACNVPWGGWTLADAAPVLRAQLAETHARLARPPGGVRVAVWDARGAVSVWDRAILDAAREGRGKPLVFLDPPYPGTFSGYAGTWRPADYEAYRHGCERLACAGVDVAITFPAAHKALLPANWPCVPFAIPDLVGGKGAPRGKRDEVLCLSPGFGA